MYGIFFEEINQAGEGGIYAELLRTRGMEDAAPGRMPVGWRAVVPEATGSVTVDVEDRPHPNRPASLAITRRSVVTPVSIVNEGFWGMPLERGERYKLRLWVKGGVPLEATLRRPAGDNLFRWTVEPSNDSWRMFETTLTPTVNEQRAQLWLTPTRPGTVKVAFTSLMPLNTFRNRPNGLRRDLAEKLYDLRPSFVRFPGGCFIEGDTLAQAFHWKDTIGPVETRRPMPSTLWGYPISNGLGFHEYLQMTEDFGAVALFVASAGMSHRDVAPLHEMPRYVQDALDAIEYAIGPPDSTWGAKRVQNGRREPFNLRYIQIGNENGGPAYDVRFGMMARAISQRFPNIRIIANDWGGVPTSFPLDIVDEHHYQTPGWFWHNSTRYDNFNRALYKLYIGEYAVTRGSGRGNLAAALSEAAFMTGLERNADAVVMASYAPLMANENNRQWNPNSIVFDAWRAYGTPSYWVQQMFSNHRPTRIVEHRVTAPPPSVRQLRGRVGLQTWRTQAEFRNLQVEADGRILLRAGELDANTMQPARGDWSVQDGVIRQTAQGEDLRAYIRNFELPLANRIVFSLQARKISGDEGFIIMMGVSPDHQFQWNLGGWNNTVHAFQSDLDRVGVGVPGRIETGRWYDIRLVREGNRTRAYLDGRFMEQVEDRSMLDFAAVAGKNTDTNEIIVKVVNGSGEVRNTNLVIHGARLGRTARVITMRGNALLDENTFDAPERMKPREGTPIRVSPRMVFRAAPLSVNVIRIPVLDE